MKCVFCGSFDSKVIDSRLSEDGCAIRRRRECISCGKRYTTYEKIEFTPVMVVKNSGERQAFDPTKIKHGVMRACEKRPISMVQIDELVGNIEKQVHNMLEQEISSKRIGDLVMSALQKLDEIAYIRFASVHLEYADLDTLLSEISRIINERRGQ